MDGHSTQLPLYPPESFQPVASPERSYVPVLQSHVGERDALKNASQETWKYLTPLVAIVGPKNPGHAPFKRQRVRNWVRNVADSVGPHACFLDTVRLSRLHRVHSAGATEPVLSVLIESAANRGMNFVPVLNMRDRGDTRNLMREAVARLGTGVAMRYPLLGTIPDPTKSADTLLEEALKHVDLQPEAADLLIDLAFIPQDVDIAPRDLAASIDEMLGVGEWRNVVLIGTAMPRTLGGGVVAEGTIGRLVRREWALWQALRSVGPKRVPTYGDYAVQHPEPPAIGESGGPGMRANVRYTLDEVTLVPRGRGPLRIEGAAQYRQLCAQIVASEGFAGESYTWGDRIIAECANGGPPGNQNMWRGAGTSHHFRHVIDQLGRAVAM